MKKFYFALFFFSFILSHRTFAQWTDVINSNINFEFNIQDNYYAGTGSPFDDEGFLQTSFQPTVRTDLYVNGWFGELCYSWNCYSATGCTNQGNGNYYYGTNWGFYQQFSTWITGHESDYDYDCYADGDDDQNMGGTYGLLRDGQTSMRLTYPSSDFYPCNWNPYLGNGGNGWLYPGNTFDQVMRMTWRYSSGYDFYNTLNFGDVTGLQRLDVNSNRGVATQSGTPLQYANTYGNSSRDVWYSFYINTPSTVTISTQNNATNFDTVLRLFDTSYNEIAANDDGGSNNSSIITITLCAGDYKFCTEGYSSNEGVFEVTVNASPLPALSIAANTVSQTGCPGTADAYVDWNVYNYASNYTVYFDGASLGQAYYNYTNAGTHTVEVYDGCGRYSSMTINVTSPDPVSIAPDVITDASCENAADGSVSWVVPTYTNYFDITLDGNYIGSVTQATGLTTGNHLITVTDGCLTQASINVDIDNGDDVVPLALCLSQFTLAVATGEVVDIDLNLVDEGSYDNCGSIDLSISPSSFDDSNGGQNLVTLTVTDSNGNTSECTSLANVIVTVGVDEITADPQFSIMPNPNQGEFWLVFPETSNMTQTAITVFDMKGSLVYQSGIYKNRQLVDLTALAPGVYNLQCVQSGKISSSRIIIE